MKITITPTKKQHQAYEALKDKDAIFFGGGAGGGKSWWLCESRLINCYLYPGYKSFIGRNELKRLMQSTYVTWQKVCKYHKIPPNDWKLNGQYNYIEFINGSRIDLLDLAFLPRDPLYERFGSLEYTNGAIEEAGEVNYLAYDMLKSRIGRHLNKEQGIKANMAITGNPKKNWTYTDFYKLWKKGELPENYAFIQSLYGDNPYTADDYGKQLSGIRDKTLKQRLMFGNWEYEDDPSTLVSYDSITDLFTNTVRESHEKFLIGDIARFGQDKTVIMLWQGWKVYKILVWEKQDLGLEGGTSGKIRDLLRDEKIPYSHCLVDEDGVGGGVVDNLRGIKGFINNSTPLFVKTGVLENYRNLKTQCAYKLADAINRHQIAIECQDIKVREMIIEELEQLKSKDIDKENKLQIISKEEIKELIGRSPDYLDCLLMRMWYKIKNIGESLYTPEEKRIAQIIRNKKIGQKMADPLATSIY